MTDHCVYYRLLISFEQNRKWKKKDHDNTNKISIRPSDVLFVRATTNLPDLHTSAKGHFFFMKWLPTTNKLYFTTSDIGLAGTLIMITPEVIMYERYEFSFILCECRAGGAHQWRPLPYFIDRMQRGLRGQGRSRGRGERKAPSVFAARFVHFNSRNKDDVKHLGGVWITYFFLNNMKYIFLLSNQ